MCIKQTIIAIHHRTIQNTSGCFFRKCALPERLVKELSKIKLVSIKYNIGFVDSTNLPRRIEWDKLRDLDMSENKYKQVGLKQIILKLQSTMQNTKLSPFAYFSFLQLGAAY